MPRIRLHEFLSSAIFALLALTVLMLLTATAYAQIEVPSEPEGLNHIAMIVGGYAFAIAGILSRFASQMKPLFVYLPASYRWIPGAIAAVTGTLIATLPLADTTEKVAASFVGAVVLGVIAWAPGHLSPDHEGE